MKITSTDNMNKAFKEKDEKSRRRPLRGLGSIRQCRGISVVGTWICATKNTNLYYRYVLYASHRCVKNLTQSSSAVRQHITPRLVCPALPTTARKTRFPRYRCGTHPPWRTISCINMTSALTLHPAGRGSPATLRDSPFPIYANVRLTFPYSPADCCNSFPAELLTNRLTTLHVRHRNQTRRLSRG